MENDPQNPETRSEWETLVDVMAGFRPEQVEPLAAARDLEMVYPLLHALTRGGLGEFFVRVAALEAFIADGRSPLKPQEAVQVLYWLKEPESILKILRESGWMEHEPGGGYRITDAGRFVATVLSFLRHHGSRPSAPSPCCRAQHDRHRRRLDATAAVRTGRRSNKCAVASVSRASAHRRRTPGGGCGGVSGTPD